MPEEAPTAPVVRELATRIVIAYVRRNQIGADQLAAVISTVHQTLVGLGKPQPAISEPAIPAVPIRNRFVAITSSASIAAGAGKCCADISRLHMD
jgi:predicted transcriptional regulator